MGKMKVIEGIRTFIKDRSNPVDKKMLDSTYKFWSDFIAYLSKQDDILMNSAKNSLRSWRRAELAAGFSKERG